MAIFPSPASSLPRRYAAAVAGGFALAALIGTGVLGWREHAALQDASARQAAAIRQLEQRLARLAEPSPPLLQQAGYAPNAPFVRTQSAEEDDNVIATVTALRAFLGRIIANEAEVAAMRGDIQALHETLIAVRDQLDARIEAAAETSAAATPSLPPQPPATAKDAASAADVAALAVYLRLLADRIDAMEGLSERVGALETAMPAQAAAPPPPAGIAENLQQVIDLQEATANALATLDERLQTVAQRVEGLTERDKDMLQALETTRITVEGELAKWRSRTIPPLLDLQHQLAGTTLAFAQADRYANPAIAQATLRQVAELTLAADTDLGLRVVGYADFDGEDEEANRITSQKRADTVREQLIALGVPPDRIVAVGRATERRVENSDAFANANRRVEFEPFLIQTFD